MKNYMIDFWKIVVPYWIQLKYELWVIQSDDHHDFKLPYVQIKRGFPLSENEREIF